MKIYVQLSSSRYLLYQSSAGRTIAGRTIAGLACERFIRRAFYSLENALILHASKTAARKIPQRPKMSIFGYIFVKFKVLLRYLMP